MYRWYTSTDQGGQDWGRKSFQQTDPPSHQPHGGKTRVLLSVHPRGKSEDKNEVSLVGGGGSSHTAQLDGTLSWDRRGTMCKHEGSSTSLWQNRKKLQRTAPALIWNLERWSCSLSGGSARSATYCPYVARSEFPPTVSSLAGPTCQCTV